MEENYITWMGNRYVTKLQSSTLKSLLFCFFVLLGIYIAGLWWWDLRPGWQPRRSRRRSTSFSLTHLLLYYFPFCNRASYQCSHLSLRTLYIRQRNVNFFFFLSFIKIQVELHASFAQSNPQKVGNQPTHPPTQLE